MIEIWKPIKGYEGKYEVSNYGNVRSKHKLLKGQESGGYQKVYLYKDNTRHGYKVHRLVAEAFISNPNNYRCVNHKDENKLNNFVDNLEWCTHKYNTNFGSCINRRSQKHHKKVIQIDSKGNKVYWDSIIEASLSLGIDRSSITKAAKQKRHSAGGYRWIYDTERD